MHHVTNKTAGPSDRSEFGISLFFFFFFPAATGEIPFCTQLTRQPESALKVVLHRSEYL